MAFIYSLQINDMKATVKFSFVIGGKEYTYYYFQENQTMVDQKNTLGAQYSHSYICFKQFSNENPSQWKEYDMKVFDKAYTNDMFKAIPEVDFNPMLYNAWNPNVLKAFTKDKKAARNIEKAYGYDFVGKASGIYSVKGVKERFDVNSCVKKCIKMENGKFAKACHMKGGMFKCCVRENFK